MRIRNATSADLSAVESLLLASELPRFGFTRPARSSDPDALKASAEFQGACPDTAVVMTRRFGAAGRARA